MTEKNMTLNQEQGVSRETTRSQARYVTPPVDILETDDGLTVVADVPGLDEQSLEISVDQGYISLNLL